jgi:hypothetical protein
LLGLQLDFPLVTVFYKVFKLYEKLYKFKQPNLDFQTCLAAELTVSNPNFDYFLLQKVNFDMIYDIFDEHSIRGAKRK